MRYWVKSGCFIVSREPLIDVTIFTSRLGCRTQQFLQFHAALQLLSSDSAKSGTRIKCGVRKLRDTVLLRPRHCTVHVLINIFIKGSLQPTIWLWRKCLTTKYVKVLLFQNTGSFTVFLDLIRCYSKCFPCAPNPQMAKVNFFSKLLTKRKGILRTWEGTKS